MRKRTSSPLRLSLLSYAIAMAAAGGAAQSAFAVDLCTGQTAITVSLSDSGNSCTLDTAGASLTVTETGLIDLGVYASVTDASVNNAGTISRSAYQQWTETSYSAYAGAYAEGLDVDGNLGASLTNSGTISASGQAYAYGYSSSSSGGTAYATATIDGVRIQGDSLSAISNSGSITANAYAYAYGDNNDAAFARARGINIQGDLSGDLTNSGDIFATANAEYANAHGILAVDVDGNLVNDGLVSANAYGYSGSAAGIQVGEISASLLNTGTIEATVNVYYGSARGISAESIAAGGMLDNSGEIRADGYGYSANARGVSVGSVSGSISNSGDIVSTVYGSGYGSGSGSGSGSGYGSSGAGTARGLVVDMLSATGSLNNMADATIRASGLGYYVDATAVQVSSLQGTLDNAGDIEGSISGIGYATGLGFSDAVGTILNTGTISASANGGGDFSSGPMLMMSGPSFSGPAYATAIDGGLLSGSLSNSGEIRAASDGYATGVSIEWLSGTVTNTAAGAIEAEASGFFADARAVVTGDLEGDLVNDGLIAAEAEGYQAYSFGVRTTDAFTGSLANGQDAMISADAYAENFADAVAVRFEGSSSSSSPFRITLEGGGLTGSLVNNGLIRASAGAGGGAFASGISVLGDFDGTITNTGDVEAEAYGEYAYAVGVLLGDGGRRIARSFSGPMSNTVISGSLTNSGDILAMASGYDAQANGVLVQGMLEGTLVNTGTIEADISGSSSSSGAYYARANGLNLDGGVTGSVSNSGSIEAYAEGYYADARAVLVDGLEGELVNDGDIYAGVNASGSARSFGIDADIGEGGLLTNNGDITADVYSSLYSSGEAVGVRLEQFYSSSSPSISFAMVAEEASTSFVNNGSISASSSAYSAMAISLHVLDSFDNNLVNAGDLNAYAEGDWSANAYGVRVSGSLNGSLENTGSITAFASAAHGGAYGVYVDNLEGTIDNSGTIAADGDFSGSGSFGLNAVHVGGGSGQVVNSGLIDGGIYLGGSVSLSNSGSIVQSAGASSYVSGDYVQQAGGKLVFNVSSDSEYGSFSAGTADFTAGNNVHVQVDPANTLATGDTLDDIVYSGNLLLPDSGAFEVTDNTVFWTFAQEVDADSLTLTATELSTQEALAGSGLSDSEVALVESVMGDVNGGTYSELALALFNSPTAQAAANIIEEAGPLLPGAPGNAARAASLGAGNAITARLSARRGASSGDAFQDNAVWIKPFLGMAEQDAVGTLNGYDVDNSGFIIGVDGDISDSWRVGLAVASSQGDVESNNSGIDLSSTHIALYGTYALSDTAALDLDVMRVATGYDSTRQVGFANSTARANFDGSQLGLGLALSKRVAMGEKSSFEPSVAVRYNRVAIDGYNETGAGVYNLTVADVREDSLLWAAKGSFEFGVGKGAILANAGIGYDTLDAASVSATFAGAGPTFTSTGAKPDSTVLMGGLGYRFVTAKNLEIDAMYDVESRGDFQAQTASVKFKLPF